MVWFHAPFIDLPLCGRRAYSVYSVYLHCSIRIKCQKIPLLQLEMYARLLQDPYIVETKVFSEEKLS